MRIAIVQFAIEPRAPERNLAKAERFIREASGNADLIVFPEDFVTGPIRNDLGFADAGGRYHRYFQQMAAKYRLDVVPGSIIERHGDLLYNTAYYIDWNGITLGRYRKIHLWHSERSYITAGGEYPVFETRIGRTALMICWDLAFPEVTRATLREGAEFIVCPSYWCYEDAGVGINYNPMSEPMLIDALCVTRAFENEAIVVFTNAAGVDERGDRLAGRSQIAAPFVGPICRLEHEREECLIQEIDRAMLADAERVYAMRGDVSPP